MNRTYRTLPTVHAALAAVALAIASPAAWADDHDDDDEDEIPFDEHEIFFELMFVKRNLISIGYRRRLILCGQRSARSAEKKYCRHQSDVKISAQAVISVYSDHLVHHSSIRNALAAIRACQR